MQKQATRGGVSRARMKMQAHIHHHLLTKYNPCVLDVNFCLGGGGVENCCSLISVWNISNLPPQALLHDNTPVTILPL